jgi:hypothetical protein
MTELRGVESVSAAGAGTDPRSQYFIFKKDGVDLKAGDELLLIINRSAALKQEEYGIPVRITEKSEPDESEFLVQYGDQLFVAQKLPEFI